MRENRLFICFFICFLFIFTGSYIFAAFENQIYTSKQASFSGGGVSYRDGDFVFINPSVTSLIKYKSFSFGYNNLLQEIDNKISQNNFLFFCPLEKFSVGIGGDILSLEDIYKESTYLLNFSRRGYGINFKILSNKYLWEDSYIEQDEVLSNREKKGYTFDFGMLKNFRNLDYGISILNILPVDIGRKTKDLVPLTLKIGCRFRKKNILKIYETNFLLELDYKNISYSSGKFNYSFSIEVWPYLRNFSFMIGLSKDYFSTGFSIQKFLKNDFSSSFLIGYAFLMPREITDFSSHYLNIIYRWGNILNEDEKIDILSFYAEKNIEIELDKKELEERKNKVKKLYKAMRQNYRARNYEEALKIGEKILKIDSRNQPVKSLIKKIKRRLKRK